MRAVIVTGTESKAHPDTIGVCFFIEVKLNMELLWMILVIITVDAVFFGTLTVIYLLERRKINDHDKRSDREV